MGSLTVPIDELINAVADAVGGKPTPHWNPWANTGDALDLAMRLDLQLCLNGRHISAPGQPFTTAQAFRDHVVNIALERGGV